MIRTSFCGRGLYGIRPCMSSQFQAHDVVGRTRWLDSVTLDFRGHDTQLFIAFGFPWSFWSGLSPLELSLQYRLQPLYE